MLATDRTPASLAPDDLRRPSVSFCGYRYRAFGARTDISGIAPASQDPSFQNRTFDAGLGIYDYRNRSFDPATGRFLQRDPVLGGDELFNPYCFPGNNAVSNVDPRGDSIVTRSEAAAKALAEKLQAIAGDAYRTVNASDGSIIHYIDTAILTRAQMGVEPGQITRKGAQRNWLGIYLASVAYPMLAPHFILGGGLWGSGKIENRGEVQMLLFASSPVDIAEYGDNGKLTPLTTNMDADAFAKGFVERGVGTAIAGYSMLYAPAQAVLLGKMGQDIAEGKTSAEDTAMGILPIVGPLGQSTVLEQYGLGLEKSGKFGGATFDAAFLLANYAAVKAMAGMRVAPKSISMGQTIEQLVGKGTIPDGAAVHFTTRSAVSSIAKQGVMPHGQAGTSSWFRYGDIKGLTLTQIRALIGGGTAGEGAGALVVAKDAAAVAKGLQWHGAYTEYNAPKPVPVIKTYTFPEQAAR